jgi:hypothetical protein
MLSREPVAAGFVGFDVLVLSFLGVLQVLGWVELSGEQLAAVTAFVVSLSGVLAGVVRRRVVPVRSFDEFQAVAAGYVEDAFAAGFEHGLVTPVPNGVSESVSDDLG